VGSDVPPRAPHAAGPRPRGGGARAPGGGRVLLPRLLLPPGPPRRGPRPWGRRPLTLPIVPIWEDPPFFLGGGGWFVGAGHPWVPNPSMCRIEGGDRVSVWAPDPAPLPLRVGGEAVLSPAFPHPLDHRGGILIHCPQRTGRSRALSHSGAQQWRSMVRGWPPRWRPPGPRGPRRPEPEPGAQGAKGKGAPRPSPECAPDQLAPHSSDTGQFSCAP